MNRKTIIFGRLFTRNIIFILCAFEAICLLFSQISNPARYALFYYPLISTIQLLSVSIYVILKTYRLGSCVFTKIAVWLFLLLQINYLLYILILCDYSFFLKIISIAIMSSILLMFLIVLFKTIIKKFDLKTKVQYLINK